MGFALEPRSYRDARLAGYYIADGQWKRLGPDLRNKVNVRKAHQQPDGKYVVESVDVFYPNAVKAQDGDDSKIFTTERIATAVSNTNRSISHGGQRPSISREHPNLYAKMLGKAAPSLGGAINWRESPRGDGWVRADLIDVDPELVDEWKKGKWTGLSAGLVNDANDLNIRFGHVALLGVESQALSELPVTEVYQAEGQLCFSADATILARGTKMENDQKRKMYAAARGQFSNLAAAFASAEAGEEGADAKVNEAFAGYNSFKEEYAGYMGGMPSGEGGPMQPGSTGALKDHGMMNAGPQAPPMIPPVIEEEECPAMGDGYMGGARRGPGYDAGSGQGPYEKTVLPQEVKDTNPAGYPDDTIGTPPGTEDRDNPNPRSADAGYAASTFAAQQNTFNAEMQDQVTQLKMQSKSDNKTIQALHKALEAMRGKTMLTQFSTFYEELEGAGHSLPEFEEASKMFHTSMKGGQEALDIFFNLLKATPKGAPSLVDMPKLTAFSDSSSMTRSSQPAAGHPNSNGSGMTPEQEDAWMSDALNRYAPGLNFSAQDLAIGKAMSQFSGNGSRLG